MTKWHSQKFISNNKEIDGLFDTTLDNILMSNYQHTKYKYDEYVKEYNKLLKRLATTKKNIEQYFINNYRNLEVKNALIKDYLDIKQKVKDFARDSKFWKIAYKLANKCYDIAKNNVGDIFYKDLADKELKDLRYIKF